MGKTFVEKILARKAGLGEVVPGQIVEVTPDLGMSHDNAAAIRRIFRKLGVERVNDPERFVVILDHVVPASQVQYAENHK